MFNVGVAYNQLDGAFETTGGSEPAYNLSTYLGTHYINDLDVTFITGPMGPRNQDVWMTGFMVAGCTVAWRAMFAWLTHDRAEGDETLGVHGTLRRAA